MRNIGQMMKQAQQMQAKMTELQQKLDTIVVEGTAGGGLVKVWMTAKHTLKKIHIDPSLLVPSEKEVLEDLIVAACNDAKSKIEKQVEEETGKLLGGLGLPPGFQLPF